MAQHRKLSKYETETSSELLDLEHTYETLSIDSDHHTVWAARKSGMDLRGFDGHVIAQVPFKLKEQHTVLSTTDERGRIWLGAGGDLAHFDKDGRLLGRTSFRRNILAIDIDGAHGRLWVATHKDIDALDSDGQHLQNVTPGPISDIKAFEYDPFFNALWVSATTHRNRHDLPAEEDRRHGRQEGEVDSRDSGSYQLYRVSQSGQLLYSIPVHGIRFLAATPDGYLWAASDKSLFRIYGQTGLVLFAIRPFDRRGNIQALSLSPSSDGVWIANDHEIKKISNDALVTQSIRVARKINDIAPYQDLLPPRIAIVAPDTGSILRTARPTIRVEYGDDAIGVDAESLSLSLNGETFGHSCDFGDGKADCIPDVVLPEGETLLGANVRDFAGNESLTATTVVTIDTVPPEIFVESPLNGESTEEEVVNVRGHISEQGRVTINGAAIELSGLHFESALHLEEGENTIRIEATDIAGNASRELVTVTREVGDVTPPEIQAPPDRTVEATGVLTPVTLGEASAYDDKDGAVLTLPSTLGPFPVGTSEVVWTAEDTSGNSRQAIQRITVRDTTPPVLIPPPHISTESSGTVAVDIGEASATDIFGPPIITNDAPARFPIGSTVVTWKARDRNGNTVTETQTITVLDENEQARTNGWQEPELLELDDKGDALDPLIARNGNGEAIAVWVQEDEQGLFNVLARYFSPDSNWSPPRPIEDVDETVGLPDVGAPELAADINASGQAVALWKFEDAGYFYNVFDPETGWGIARRLAMSDAGSSADLQSMAHTSDGSFVAIWGAEQPDGSANLVARRYSSGTGWGAVVALESNAPNVHSALAKITTNGTGGALIAWERLEPRVPGFPEYGSMSDGTWSATFDPENGWSDPLSMDIRTPDFSNVLHTRDFMDVVLDDSGAATTAWLEPGVGINFPVRILAKTYNPASGWSSEEEIQGPSPEALPPRLVHGSGGDLYLVWFATDAESQDFSYRYELRYSRSTDGGVTWTAPLVGFTYKDVERVVGQSGNVRLVGLYGVEGDNSGPVHAVFLVTIEQVNDRPAEPLLLSTTYYPETGWTAPEIISRQLPRTFIHRASIRSDGMGNALAVWEQQDQETFHTDLWTNRLILPLANNVAPVADAGPDVTVLENKPLVLDATRSEDPDGSVYRYRWTQIEGPTVVVDDPESPVVHIAAVPIVDSDTTLKFRLKITDNRNRTSSDEVTVRIHNLGVDEDKIAPVVNAPPDISAPATAVLTPVDLEFLYHATAFDNGDGELVPAPNPAGPFPLGDTVVTWSAGDSAGNIGHATQTVTVYDTRAPSLTVPQDVSIKSAVPVTVDIGTATADDIFGPVVVTNDAPAIFPLGRTEVVWTATDQNGNTSTAVQNVSVFPSTWDDPAPIELDAAAAGPPSVDIDDAGNGVAVWVENDGVNYAVMANRYSPESGWGSAQPITVVPQGGTVSVSDPKVASYGEGAALAVWYQVSVPDYRVMFSRLDADTGWSDPKEVFTGTFSDLAISGGTGSVVMGAVQYPGRNLVVSRYTDEQGWSDWFTVASDVLVRGFDVNVSNQGRAAIAWSESNDVWFRYLEPSTGWSAAIQPVSGFGEYPKVSIDNGGTAFLAWNHALSSYSYDPYATVFHPGTGFEASAHLDSRSYEIGDISSDDNGGALVSWVYRATNSSRYTPESGWSSPEQMDFFRGGGDRYVNLEADAPGRVVAVWRHNSGGGIYANRFVPGGIGWAYPEPLAMDNGWLGQEPALAVPPDGHAIAVWQQKDSDGIESIWAARLMNTSEPNQPPMANAGEDGKILSGAETTLDGSGSSDPEGSVLSVEWMQVTGPVVNLSDSSALVATFTAPQAPPGTQLVFRLSVTDGRGATDTDSVTLTVTEPDVVPPDVTPPADKIIEATGILTAVELGGATATDDVDGAVQAVPSNAGPFSLGEHTVVWSATDSSGNTGTATQLITVRDTTPPAIVAPRDVAVVAAYAGDLDIRSASASDIFGPVAITNDAPDEFPIGETTVTWTATDANGNTSTAVQSVRVESEITISITTPEAGMETEADTVLVSGTLIGPRNTGVTVNGQPVQVDRSHTPARFFGAVPLALGENVITVVATYTSGESTARTVNVLRTKVNPAPFVVSATPSAGMAPLEVAFAVDRETAVTPETSDDTIYVVDYDFDGDGTVDLSRSSFTLDGGSIVFEPADLTEPVTHHYDAPGTYVARVTINDFHNVDPRLSSTGNTFTIPIEVGSASRMDRMFRDIWKELLDSLANKDVEGALKLFSPSARPKYEEPFTALMPQIDKVIPNLGELVQGELMGDDLAVYYLRRGDRGFPIQFVRGLDGVWRIAEM